VDLLAALEEGAPGLGVGQFGIYLAVQVPREGEQGGHRGDGVGCRAVGPVGIRRVVLEFQWVYVHRHLGVCACVCACVSRVCACVRAQARV